jgi:hypothetical protein
MLVDLYRYRGLLVIILVLMVLAITIGIRHNRLAESPPPESESAAPSFCGELIPWEEADQLFPKYAKARIVDVDTRLSFWVQRRAGTEHADVQPLTKEDTEIMKTIYQGKWSWQRKAIIVELEDGRRLAASMHGMPHGAGAIRGNNFNGHFCVHFWGSTTHGSKKPNRAHQIMVWKAAGQFDQQLEKVSAPEAIDIFFTAVDQGATPLAARLLDDSPESQLLLARSCKIQAVRLDSITEQEDKGYEIKMRLVFSGEQKEYKKTLNLYFQKPAPPWIIQTDSVQGCFDKPS